jgi:hypothetical protein
LAGPGAPARAGPAAGTDQAGLAGGVRLPWAARTECRSGAAAGFTAPLNQADRSGQPSGAGRANARPGKTFSIGQGASPADGQGRRKPPGDSMAWRARIQDVRSAAPRRTRPGRRGRPPRGLASPAQLHGQRTGAEIGSGSTIGPGLTRWPLGTIHPHPAASRLPCGQGFVAGSWQGGRDALRPDSLLLTSAQGSRPRIRSGNPGRRLRHWFRPAVENRSNSASPAFPLMRARACPAIPWRPWRARPTAPARPGLLRPMQPRAAPACRP